MVCANGKQNSYWKFPFGVGVYHLNNRPMDKFDIFKMAAEIVILNEIIMPQLTRNCFSIMRKMKNST